MCNCYMMNKYSAVIVSQLVIKCCAMYYYCAEVIGEYYETWDAVLGSSSSSYSHFYVGVYVR